MTLLLLFSGLAEGHLLEIGGKEISGNWKLKFGCVLALGLFATLDIYSWVFWIGAINKGQSVI